MVLMFPTCFDDTLQLLSTVEKNPRRYYSHHPNRNLRRYQIELRFFRMFLWCFPDCDANLLADLDFIATSIARFVDTYRHSALSDTEFYTSRAKVDVNFRKCHAGMNRYRQHLISSSLKAEPFTAGNQTIKFLDFVHVSINDLLEYAGDGFPIDTLEELVFLLRNLVYYTPMGGENSFGFHPIGNSFGFLLCFPQYVSDANTKTDLIFQFNVHDWANKAACFLLLCWLTEREDEEIRRLYIDLQQKVNPGNPEFTKLCFEVIKVPKMKRVDRLLFGEFVSRFADFFTENLMLILNDDVRIVREGLIFLITFLADPPSNTVDHSELSSIREQVYAVLDHASDTICLFGEANMDLARGKTILDDFQKSIDKVSGKIEDLYVHIPRSSWSNFPRIDRLGHFESLLEYLEILKEAMNKNNKLVPFLKHHIFTIQEELLPLRLFLRDTSAMQNEHNRLKDIWEQITSLLNQEDFAIKSSFFIDDAIWYNLACLSFVVRNIKDVRYKVSNIEFETQTEGSDKVNSLPSFLRTFKLVQVLDLKGIENEGEFPMIVTTLVHLRYLALRISGILYVPPDISNLWNLETLVLSVFFPFLNFPNDIWKMKRLRHVEARPSACVALGGVTGDSSLLPDLQTFTKLCIPPREDGEELLRRISNVRKFSCRCSSWWDPHLERNQLPKLEILTVLESLEMFHSGEARPPFMFSFPSTISKLTLRGFHLPWNEFSANSFSGKTWNVDDEEFPNIKSLTLRALDIEEWNASTDSFPSLEKLDVFWCHRLIEIPPCFSEVATLKCINVRGCEKRVADSAIQIQKDQFDSGNESFEVKLSDIWT